MLRMLPPGSNIQTTWMFQPPGPKEPFSSSGPKGLSALWPQRVFRPSGLNRVFRPSGPKGLPPTSRSCGCHTQVLVLKPGLNPVLAGGISESVMSELHASLSRSQGLDQQDFWSRSRRAANNISWPAAV